MDDKIVLILKDLIDVTSMTSKQIQDIVEKLTAINERLDKVENKVNKILKDVQIPF